MMTNLPVRSALLWAVLLAGVAAASTALAQPSTFVVLDETEARIAFFEAEARATSAELVELSRRLELHTHDADTAQRATVKLQRDTTKRMASWERAWRAIERDEGHWSVGAGSDTRQLLSAAQPKALATMAPEFALLRTVHQDRQRVDLLLVQNLKLGVELAQNTARKKAAEREREVVVEQAKSPQQRARARAELDKSEAELAEMLDTMTRNQTAQDFHRLKGTLVAPVSGQPTHPFGPRKQRESMSYVRHTGLTYQVAVGTSVRAVASGLVVLAQRFEGYGNLVIVDHGANYHSVYAHLESIEVGIGKQLARNEALGTSGQTGSIEGPKLYFELRHEGQPIDPAPWFLKR
ncbi:MAG: peptidoglycan DD-metalloendopeptidase family protein [Bradymonadaceae bacterium]|nr:peptidoglycan DD-metalloendopeptidase family protein [Lujinxingiaceae bacterium]